MTEYTNKFTLDGRIKPGAGVTKTKVQATKSLLESALRGSKVAAAQFQESITTSDLAFNAAYLTQIQVLQQFDELPRTWTQIASVRSLPDFRPAVLSGLFGEFVGLERQGTAAGDGNTNPEGVAPVVAELAQYPYASIGEVEAAYGQLKKHGFKVGMSWEAIVNDAVGFFASLPGEMIQTILDTEEWVVYRALIDGTQASSQLTGGTIYDGGPALNANSAIGRRAVLKAIQDLANRQINGRNIVVTGGYNLIVPLGATAAVEFSLQQPLLQSNPAAAARGYVVGVNDPGTNILSQVTIIESEWVTGTNWYLLPKPGAVRRPVLELGRLRGHETPELRVNNYTGNFLGGGAVAPFEGDFDFDSADLRIRQPMTGILWNDDYVVWSTGAGAYVPNP